MQYARIVTIAMVAIIVGCPTAQQASGADAGRDAAAPDAAPVAMDAAMRLPPPAHASSPPPDARVDVYADASIARDAGMHAGSSGDDDAGDEAAAPHDAGKAIDAATPAADQTMPVIVAAGANHTLYLSIDNGMTFCQVKREVPADIGDGYDNVNLFRHIAYANGHFIAGSATKVFASTNGYDWQDVTDGDRPATGTYVAEIDYGNGYWVGVGASGTVMRSTDLKSWERVNANWQADNARSLAFGNGKFVASRDNSGWWSSTDGSTWQPFDTSQHGGVVFDAGQFIPDPGYRHGGGIRVRATNKTIERAEDRDGAPYVTVATLQDSIADFAFGDLPAADYAPGKVTPPALAECLGR
jgi:hypothetical protein